MALPKLILAFLSLSSFYITVFGAVITRGSGMYDVTISHLGILDPSRQDPYAPNISDTRKFMVSHFFPIWSNRTGEKCSLPCKQPYMPPATARVSNAQFFGNESAGVFEQVEWNICCGTSEDLDPNNFTAVILEPAVGTSRFLYGGIAQEIASHGYGVFTIDHPYDSSIVEYSDARENTTIKGALELCPFEPINPWNDTITKAVKTRADDIKFLVSSLNNMEFYKQLLPGYTVSSHFNTTRGVGIVGHGLGGTVATHLSVTDPRFPISVNMAGTPPLLEDDTYSQIVFLGRKSARRENDINWPETWKHLRDKATEFDMQDAGVFDYSDLPGILNFMKMSKDGVKGVGSIVPWKAFGIAAQWPRAYMDIQFTSIRNGGIDLHDLVQFFIGEMVPYTPKGS